MSEVVEQGPCEECGSSDAATHYDDGHTYCFSCGHHDKGDNNETRVASSVDRVGGVVSRDDVEFRPLKKRCITQATCEHFGYGYIDGVQAAPFYDGNKLVAYKMRGRDKKFSIRGDGKKLGLWGQHLWRDGGRKVVITEGELDAMSMSQVQDNKWPVVSLPQGAQSAAKAIKKSLDWLEKFDEVVLCFDMDEPGQAAVEVVGPLLKPGKVKVMRLPLKDANEMLQAGRGPELRQAMWDAKVWRPDGIVSGMDMFDVVTKDPVHAGLSLPWPSLNSKLRGLHDGKIFTVTAGEGIGKSTLCRELAYHIGVVNEQNVGYIGLEENLRESGLALMSIHMNERLNIDYRTNEELTDDEKLSRRTAFEATLGTGRFYFYEHFGSTDVDNLLARVRYLARACDCRYIVLDHLSIVVSSMEEDQDERKLIDKAMTLLRMLVEETGICLILVVHLSRGTEGKGYDEGARPRLSKLRGSAAIGQLSDQVVSLERDMQSDDPSLMTVRILKSRQVGITGVADTLRYDHETGRYQVVKEQEHDFDSEY
jgi:twinkle protein